MSAFALTSDHPAEVEPPTATPGKTRSSCDRCHSQKLRCVKRSGGTSCERCQRLRCRCRYSPRAPRVSRISRQPSELSKQSTQHERLSITASDLAQTATWSGIGLGGTHDGWQFPLATVSNGLTGQTDNDMSASEPLDTLDPTQIAFIDAPDMDYVCNLQEPPDTQLLNTSTSSGPSIVQVNDHCRDSFSSAIRRLVTLQVDVCDCLACFPSADNTDDGTTLPTDSSRCSRPQTEFSFDELFRLTTDFVEIMEAVTASLSCSSFESLLFSANLHNYELDLLCLSPEDHITNQLVYENSTTASLLPLSHVDKAMILGMASCHRTLMELYSAIFRRMQTCLEHSLAPRSENSWKVVLPQVQVGSLALPPLEVSCKSPVTSKATSSMYMVVITALSTQLWEKVGGALRRSAKTFTDATEESESSSYGMAWRTMKDGTDNLMQEITRIQRLLR